jgi:hypothetical protein
MSVAVATKPAAALNSSSASNSFGGAPFVPELETLLLSYLDDAGISASILDSQDWLTQQGKPKQHEKLIPVLSSLEMANYITRLARDHSRVSISAEGEVYRTMGTPEAQIWRLLPSEGSAPQKTIEEQMGKALFQLGLNHCMSKRWVEFEGRDKKVGMLKRKVRACHIKHLAAQTASIQKTKQRNHNSCWACVGLLLRRLLRLQMTCSLVCRRCMRAASIAWTRCNWI